MRCVLENLHFKEPRKWAPATDSMSPVEGCIWTRWCFLWGISAAWMFQAVAEGINRLPPSPPPPPPAAFPSGMSSCTGALLWLMFDCAVRLFICLANKWIINEPPQQFSTRLMLHLCRFLAIQVQMSWGHCKTWTMIPKPLRWCSTRRMSDIVLCKRKEALEEKKGAKLSAEEVFISHAGNGATICHQMLASPWPGKLAGLVWDGTWEGGVLNGPGLFTWRVPDH